MNPNHEETLFAFELEKLAERRPHFWTPCAKGIRHFHGAMNTRGQLTVNGTKNPKTQRRIRRRIEGK